MSDSRPCQQCGTEFTPKRSHQKFCGKECRALNHAAHPPGNGIAATLKSLRVLGSGMVSATIHFPLDERERALRMTPRQAVNVLPCS